MVLWGYQRDAVRWMQENILEPKDFLLDKSRDMGATWMMLGLILYNFLFTDNFNALIGSWKEEYVDKRGDKNTHFERLRFMIRRLPTRLYYELLNIKRPGGFVWREHSSFMRLVNPVNGSQVMGESTNANFGRAGRNNLVWLDEMARIENNMQKEIWMGLADLTPCRVATSTPNGRANHFARLRFGSGIRTRTLRWTLHPKKSAGLYYFNRDGVRIQADAPSANELEAGNCGGFHLRSPWYDAEEERRRANPAELAQEVDIDYLTSGDPVFNPGWSRAHTTAQIRPRFKLHPIITWKPNGKPEVRWESRPQDGEYWVWSGKPKRESVYCMGVDVAEGLKDQDTDPDYHAVVLWDVTKCHVVAALRTRNLDPRDLAAVVSDLAGRYEAFLTIERNGPGLAVLSVLDGILTGYNLDTEVFRPRRFEQRVHSLSRDAGFQTTPKSKPHLIELVRHWTPPEQCHLRDERLVNEYSIFSRLPGYKMGAPPGSHDDMVIALGLALVAAQEALGAVPIQSEVEDGVEELIRLQHRAEQGEDIRVIAKELKRIVG
jgi:hypothetical protein